MRPWLYEFLYRRGAAWDRVGIGPELKELVETGRLDPKTHPRVLDMGCGTGSNAVYLASKGFSVTGLDFTEWAVEAARKRVEAAGLSDRCEIRQGDLCQLPDEQVNGCFDLVVDYGTLDDMPGPQRRRAGQSVISLTRPGSLFFLWCFSVHKKDLPWVALHRMSRLMHSQMVPGEEQSLFGRVFDIERLPDPPRPEHAAVFLMTRR